MGSRFSDKSNGNCGLLNLLSLGLVVQGSGNGHCRSMMPPARRGTPWFGVCPDVKGHATIADRGGIFGPTTVLPDELSAGTT